MRCPKCNMPIPKKDAAEHEESVHAEVECEDCHAKMEISEIDEHKGNICPKRKVLCEFCELNFPFDELHRHQQTCGAVSIQCEVCGARVPKMQMEQHVATHFKPVEKMNCCLCGREFTDPQELEEHMWTCNGAEEKVVVNPFERPQPRDNPPVHESRPRHDEKKEKKDKKGKKDKSKPEEFECPICGEVFEDMNQLDFHVGMEHGDEDMSDNGNYEAGDAMETEHICPICGKKFPTLGEVEKHASNCLGDDDNYMQGFDDEVPFVTNAGARPSAPAGKQKDCECPICFKMFTADEIEDHCLTHF